MSTKALFVTWRPKDALDGMAQLDPWEELAYRRILDLIFVSGDRLFDNDTVLATATKTGRRWKRIKRALIEKHQKLTVDGGCIRNVQARKTLDDVERLVGQKSDAGKASAEARKLLKAQEPGSTAVERDLKRVNDGGPTATGTEPATAPQPTTKPLNHLDTTPDSRARTVKAAWERCYEVAQNHIDASPRLQVYAEIANWLEQGCDLELDILPTIRALCTKPRRRRISSWGYFSAAVFDAHAQRTAPRPSQTVTLHPGGSRNGKPAFADQQARDRADILDAFGGAGRVEPGRGGPGEPAADAAEPSAANRGGDRPG